MSSSDGPNLVTIGIPTYNRPDGLRKTLECMTQQSYSNLEIIVSDNCSPDPAVQKVVQEFAKADPRIHYYRRETNFGSIPNFIFLLEKAKGDFFMWAADDDEWDLDFIERMLKPLIEPNSKFVAAVSEAQYMVDGVRCEFVREGEAFSNFTSDEPFKRIRQVIMHSYGNLLYSLFRTKVIQDVQLGFYRNRQLYFNEIPLLIHVAQNGNWLVSSEIGWIKRTRMGVFNGVLWENGHLRKNAMPKGRFIRRSFGTAIYHLITLTAVCMEIDRLRVRKSEKLRLKALSSGRLAKHTLEVITGTKI